MVWLGMVGVVGGVVWGGGRVDAAGASGPKRHRGRKRNIPYVAVVGEQEASSRTVNVNDRDGRQSDDMSLDVFVAMLLRKNRPRPESEGPDDSRAA